MAAPDDEFRVEDAGELLQQAGLRKTVARINILQCLAIQTAPVTHAEIVDKLSSLGFDASTIFRGLSDLTDAGVISRLDLGDRTWRFELREPSSSPDQSSPQHPHVLCRVCGRIECLELREHRAEYAILKNWRIEEVLFKGTCRDCMLQNARDV